MAHPLQPGFWRGWPAIVVAGYSIVVIFIGNDKSLAMQTIDGLLGGVFFVTFYWTLWNVVKKALRRVKKSGDSSSSTQSLVEGLSDMSAAEKKEFVSNMTAAEKRKLVSNLTKAGRRELVSDMTTTEKQEFISDMTEKRDSISDMTEKERLEKFGNSSSSTQLPREVRRSSEKEQDRSTQPQTDPYPWAAGGKSIGDMTEEKKDWFWADEEGYFQDDDM
jgi:hypothetical protein